jgi:1-acyl-sn-glycerol-3-phosphate acyltransferase
VAEIRENAPFELRKVNPRKLRTLLVFIPLVTVYTIVCGSVSFLLALIFRSGNPSHWVARLWAWLILKTCGIRVSIDGLEHLNRDQKYVLASNHQSLFDIPILFAYLPISFRILFKRSLLQIPFLGWHLWVSGHIPVDRANPVKARQSLNRASEHLSHKGSIAIFPEGTRSHDGSIGRFKHGSFVLAVRAGIPVVPVTISESWRVMERGKVTVHPRHVKVHVDRPLSVDCYDERSVTDLSRAVRNVVESHYEPSSLAVDKIPGSQIEDDQAGVVR